MNNENVLDVNSSLYREVVVSYYYKFGNVLKNIIFANISDLLSPENKVLSNKDYYKFCRQHDYLLTNKRTC